MQDPRKYAIDYMESVFEAHNDKFQKAYNKGRRFALAINGIVEKGEEMYYLDAKPIDKNLPESYSLGDTLTSPNQTCHNCKFYADDYCIKWDAIIRHEYWCDSWEK